MMASSTSSANQINRRRTSLLPLRRLLAFPTEFQRLDLESASDLTDAKRLQPIVDVGYLRNCRLLLDCKILLRTIAVVLAGEGL